MDDALDRTNKREEYLRSEGYEVITKWECEFLREKKTNPELKAYLKDFDYFVRLDPRDALAGVRENIPNVSNQKPLPKPISGKNKCCQALSQSEWQ